MRRSEPAFPASAWRKSSYSGTQTECVEVAYAAERVGVRDTKHRDGGAVIVPASAWRAFTGRI